MQDTALLRTQLAVAASRVVDDLEADGHAVADYELTDLAERVVGQLDDFAVILGAATGRGRTAAGESLAERLWAQIGGRL